MPPKAKSSPCRSSRERSDQLGIGGRELKVAQLAARHPLHVLTEQRPRLAQQFAREEMQLDVAILVRMRCREQLEADACLDIELFAQLACQTPVEPLAWIAFAPGKLPEALEMDAALASRDEDAALALDDRRGYDDRRHTHARAIGQTRHLGFRATQTVAPRSISA